MDRLFWPESGPAGGSLCSSCRPTPSCDGQRRRFREHWTQLWGRPTGGRPPVDPDIAALVRTMAAANPLWGAPRIHGELLKLGIDVAERTVSRLLPKWRPQPAQTWRTFLATHVRDLVSIDVFTVPTARLRVFPSRDPLRHSWTYCSQRRS
jgi:putative transposase